MSVNRVFLVGNLGKDPEVRYSASGTALCNMTLATSERYKDKNGEWQETTEWHNLVTFGKRAEACGNMLQKGSTVAVTGKIKTRKWEDRDGNTRYTTEIDCQEIDFIARLRPKDQQQSEPPFNPDDDIAF